MGESAVPAKVAQEEQLALGKIVLTCLAEVQKMQVWTGCDAPLESAPWAEGAFTLTSGNTYMVRIYPKETPDDQA